MTKWKDKSRLEKSLSILAGAAASAAVYYVCRDFAKRDMRKVLEDMEDKRGITMAGISAWTFRHGNKSSTYWHKKIYGD